MKKSAKFLTGACIAVGVLGAALAVILSLPSDKNQDTVSADGTDLLLFDKSALHVDDITIKNRSGEYRLLGYDYAKEKDTSQSSDTSPSNVPVVYTMQEYPESLLSGMMTNMLVSECQTAAALRIVDKSGKKYRDYGLAPPSAEAVIVYSDDSVIKLSLGDEAPDKSGTYCRIDGDKNVYLVNSSSVDMFLMDKLQLFDKTLSDEMEESDSIASVSVSGSGYEKPVLLSNEPNDRSQSPYTMTSPYFECCDSSASVGFASLFFDMTASEVAAAGVKEAQRKEYGLDKPYMDVRITTESGREIEILASEKDDDGYYYLMKKNGNIIYRESAEETAWYGVTYKEFLNDAVFMPDLFHVGSAVITCEGTAEEYVLKRETVVNEMYEEVVQTTLYYHDEIIDYSRLFHFIQNIAGITREENAPDSSDGCEELLNIRLNFEGGQTEAFALYQTPDEKVFTVLNGHIENYTDRDYALQVIAQVPKIHSDESLEILEKSAE